MKIAQICIILGALMLPTIGSVQYSHAQNEFPGIRLTGDGIGGVTTDYQLVPFGNATDGGFAIGSDANPGDQFFIMNPAPQAAININGTGMGIGTPFNIVDQTLHVRGGSGAAYPRARIFVEDVSTAPGFRTLLDLTNNGGIRIDLNDTSPDTVDWTIDTFNNTMSDGSRLTSFDIGHDTGFPFRIMGDTATNQAFLWEGGLTIGRNPINQPASGVVGNLEVFADGTSANGAFATISSRVDAPANSVARTSMHLENNGGIFMTFKDSSLDSEWTFGNSNDALRLGRTGGGQSGFLITNTGNFLFQFDQDGNGVAENMFFVNQTGTAFGTDFSRLSDKNQKENFREIDKQEILSKIVDLPISKWNYKKDKEKFAHIGPMAQDFYGAFQVGVSDKRISDVDTTGVAFAAIQALNEKLESKEKQIVEQANQIDELMGRLQRLESLVAAPQN